MATATSPKAAPARVLRSLPPGLVRALPAATVVLLVAVVVWAVYDPWYLNYDARYALDWARDLTRGLSPDFTAPFAPTPHPFSIVLSLLGVPFGHSGDQVIVWLVLLSFGLLVWLSYRLGAVLFNPWVGAVTGLVVATRPALLRDTLLAYQDIWFELLVVGAVLLHAGRRRRGWPVLALLAAAGLVRPEGWVLAGLYWLYLWRGATPRQRAIGAAIVAAAPLIWCLMDLVVTGDPLHSLHGTAALAEVNERRLGIEQAPYWTLQYFAFTLRAPLLLGIVIGAVFAWRHRQRQVLVPLAAAAVLTVVFAAGPLAGLPLIGRYVRTPSVLIAVLYGLAVCGWMLVPRERHRGRERRAWMAVGALVALASVVYLPSHLGQLDGLRTRAARESSLYSDVRAAGQAPAVSAAFSRCKPLSAGDHRPVPYIRWWLGGNPGSVGTVERDSSPMGKLVLAPRHTYIPRWFYGKKLRAADPHPPAGYAQIYANRSWRVFAAPGC